MSNDDRPKFSVVSNDTPEIDENGVLARQLVLGDIDGTGEFMAGIYIGAIIAQLQQAKFAGMELDQLHPMPAPKTHLHVVERVVEFFKAHVEVESCEDDEGMVWCSFADKRTMMHVVQSPN
jgi:hypothetical protein